MATPKEVLLNLKTLVALENQLNADINTLQAQTQQKVKDLEATKLLIAQVRAELEAEVDKLAIDAK